MEPGPNDCEICGWLHNEGVRRQWSADCTVVICPRCGEYEWAGRLDGLRSYPSWSPDIGPPLSCACRQASQAGQPLRITGANARELAAQHANTRVSENQDRLLKEIASMGRPNSSRTFSLDTDFTLIDAFTKAEFEWYLQWLFEQKLAFPTSRGPGSIEIALSMEGWKLAQPTRRQGGIPGRCFVAMWFDESMNDVFDLGIGPAVTDCGFPAPVRIDRKEHNNQITDEIMAEIRDAEFVIADFSGNRGGVYYEAGFARGLGRPVIHSCREQDFDGRHFDTKLINHIKWSSVTDLRIKLTNRIKATIIPKV